MTSQDIRIKAHEKKKQATVKEHTNPDNYEKKPNLHHRDHQRKSECPDACSTIKVTTTNPCLAPGQVATFQASSSSLNLQPPVRKIYPAQPKLSAEQYQRPARRIQPHLRIYLEASFENNAVRKQDNRYGFLRCFVCRALLSMIPCLAPRLVDVHAFDL